MPRNSKWQDFSIQKLFVLTSGSKIALYLQDCFQIFFSHLKDCLCCDLMTLVDLYQLSCNLPGSPHCWKHFMMKHQVLKWNYFPWTVEGYLVLDSTMIIIFFLCIFFHRGNQAWPRGFHILQCTCREGLFQRWLEHNPCLLCVNLGGK